MHVSYASALVVAAVLASLLLALGRAERLFSVVALVASGLEALIIFKVVTFAVRPVHIDVVLPAILVISGAICWSRLSTKGQVTAATVVCLVGLIQLLTAIHVFR